uniref:Uncharacterized protein n=1 Tax=Neotessella volvocina TaxID=52559 RepID=A0A3G2R0X4_9STRA|nr:hypothetical protein [Neotessella volvocina]AYO28760.1 hypothetical protein [Neotessella volvocina]
MSFQNYASFSKQFFLASLTSFKLVKTILIGIHHSLEKYSVKYPRLTEIIQLTFIYYFAFIDLVFGVLSNVYALGYISIFLEPIYPIAKAILMSTTLRILAAPERIFFLSYLVIELMVIRSIFNFSTLVRYNILLLFSLLMLQGLAISLWDILFHREVVSNVAKWAFDQGAIVHTDRVSSALFFTYTFVLFLFLYIFLYIRALEGKLPTFKFVGAEWITDSVAFWFRIKTPTMRFGKGEGKQ